MTSFRPLRWLSNPHVQTILANFLDRFPGKLPTREHLVPLSDGDSVVLHETIAPASALQPIALLVHGLGGCAHSGYMQRIARRLTGEGWRVFRMDLRGAGAGMPRARRFYTAACSQDVRNVADHLAQAFPQSPLAVVGFSLGGNIVLKFAGESAAQAPPNLRAVAAIAPPIDLVRCSALVTALPLYDAFYVHHLTKQVRQHQQYFPDLPKVVLPRRLTLRQFDDLYTAPRWGYADAFDYYRQASAFSWIAAIRTPTFILTARDDPFVAVEPFEQLQAPPGVEIHISVHGGHLGFLGRDEAGGIRWAETQIVHWLKKQISCRMSALLK